MNYSAVNSSKGLFTGDAIFVAEFLILFIGGKTVMDIQNSRGFSYAELKFRNPQTTTSMANRFCVFRLYCNLSCCSVQQNSNFTVPLDINYCP